MNSIEAAHRNEVNVRGSENPDKAWILTDFDVWEKNPYYNGPDVPHPEDDRAEEPSTPPMSNKLHFSQLMKVKAEQVNRPVDSGNGYYSYSYYLLPFTGKIVASVTLSNVACILHDRFYRAPFASLGEVSLFATHDKGGLILFSVTYHHGD